MTFDEGRDYVLSVFKAAWDTQPSYAVTWNDVPAAPPGTDVIWARPTVRHATGRQSSLSGEIGLRKFQHTGTVFVQIFGPVGDGLKQVYSAANLVKNAYEDSRHENLWFRNVRLNEIGENGGFQQFNVLADFLYDEVR